MSGGSAGAGTSTGTSWLIVTGAGAGGALTVACTFTLPVTSGAGGGVDEAGTAGGGAPCGAKLAKNVLPGPETSAVISGVIASQFSNDGML